MQGATKKSEKALEPEIRIPASEVQNLAGFGASECRITIRRFSGASRKISSFWKKRAEGRCCLDDPAIGAKTICLRLLAVFRFSL